MSACCTMEVSSHAIERWTERFGGCMEESLSRAVPFGAQRGTDKLLRDGSAVFVVSKDGYVKTVLTIDQAYANMQSQGIRTTNQDSPRADAQRIVQDLVEEIARAGSNEEIRELGKNLGVESLAKYVIGLRKKLTKQNDALLRLYRGEMDGKIVRAITDAANSVGEYSEV